MKIYFEISEGWDKPWLLDIEDWLYNMLGGYKIINQT